MSNITNWLFKTLRTISLTLILGIGMSANAGWLEFGEESWKEEVLLHDGIKTGTGWVTSDDGMLVWDRNGNGTIDSGRELFGDNTLKSNGQLAADGFDALADLDTNADGIVNSSDTNFSNLHIWRDLNQDGISQSNELFALTSLGIAGINVALVYPYTRATAIIN